MAVGAPVESGLKSETIEEISNHQRDEQEDETNRSNAEKDD